MNLLRYIFFSACFYILSGEWVSAQNNLVKTVTLTSVNCTLDTLNTPEKAQKAASIIQNHPEVKDFDLKARSCNFTLENQNKVLDTLLLELKTAGFKVDNLLIFENQTFTKVPLSEQKPRKEITEEEAQKLKEKGMLPKE